MAEADDRAEEVVAEEGAASPKILGLPKKIFLMVAGGLLVVLLAVGGYFLFSKSDNPSDVEGNSQAQTLATPAAGDSLFFPSENGAPAAPPVANQGQIAMPNTSGQMPAQMNGQSNELMTQIFQLREQVINLREENLVLKKRIYELETQGGNNGSTPGQSSNNETKANQYKDLYDKELKDYPPIRPAVPVEKPKPKWG